MELFQNKRSASSVPFFTLHFYPGNIRDYIQYLLLDFLRVKFRVLAFFHQLIFAVGYRDLIKHGEIIGGDKVIIICDGA